MSGPRLLLAAKTALAVGIAWAIAPHMPGVTDNYPYYAPLGVLVSMYPTLMSSARSGLQTLIGLGAGITLAVIVVATAGPTWWTIPLIVGVGVIVSGTGWFGAGKEYVPMAALFVLIIGGNRADAYSTGYLVQMSVGIIIGLAVNFLIAPQLTTRTAAARIDTFQRQLADHLDGVAAALHESWPPEHAEWASNTDQLAKTAESVRAELAAADESRKGNPRAVLRREAARDDHQRLDVLDRCVFHIRDISAVLSDTIWDRPGAYRFDPALTGPLSDACHAVADAIRHDDLRTAEGHRVLGSAARAIRSLIDAVDERSAAAGQVTGPGVLTAMHLRRILTHLREAQTGNRR